MTIQSDREAAADLAHALGVSCEDFTSGAADILVQAFTAHREAEKRRIVEWLRQGGTCKDWSFKPSIGIRFRAAWLSFRRPWTFAKVGQERAADAIETGAHHDT